MKKISFDLRRFSAEKNTVLFCITALFFLIFLIQYSGRAIDDSRLSSWNDAFESADLSTLFIFLSVAAAVTIMVVRKMRIDLFPAFFLFFASYAASTLFWKEPEVIVDAARYITEAKQIEVYGIGYFFREWGGNIAVWTDLPLLPFIYGMIFSIFGENRIFIQAVNSLFFSLTVVLTFLTGRELWNEKTGFNAGLFLLGIPYLYTQVPLYLVDVATMFFLMLSVFTFLGAIKKGGIMVPISALSIFSAFFSKYSVWLMLTVLIVISAVILSQKRKDHMETVALRLMIVGFISSLLISVAIAFKHDVIVRQIHLLIEYQKPGLERWGESLLSTFFFQVHPVVTLAALFSCGIAFKKKDLSFLIVGWLVVLVMAFQIRRIRYIIPVFPMLSLMAAYGLTQIKNKTVSSFIPMLTAAFSFVIAFSVFLPFLSGISAANLMNAGEYLDSIDADQIELITLSSEDSVLNPAVAVPIIDLYTGKKISYQYNAQEIPLPSDIDISSLRFTWNYRNPGYYQNNNVSESSRRAVAVISDRIPFTYPEEVRSRIQGLSKKKSFDKSDSVFINQTLVTVYH